MENEIQSLKFQTPTTLPDEHDIIFGEILPRLPVKSLIRFKSVSKLWLSTISTPQFAKSHQKLHTSRSLSPQFLIFSDSSDCDSHPLFTSVSFGQHGRVEETLKFNYAYNGDGHMCVVGCCNGLVCFRDKNYNFYICNPATQQCSDITTTFPYNSSDDNIISVAFCYVSSIDDYKIVCLTNKQKRYIIFQFNQLVNTKVYIFSLRTCKWEISLSRLNIDGVGIDRDGMPALMNDVLYWCSSSADYSTNRHFVIVGVNLINSEITTIPVTIENMANLFWPHQRLDLFVIKGRLFLCYGRKSLYDFSLCDCQVWSLNKDGLSWTKMYHLNCNEMRLLGISETGKWLALNGKLLALLDPSKSFHRQYQGGTHFADFGDDDVFNAWDYKMSLVSTFPE